MSDPVINKTKALHTLIKTKLATVEGETFHKEAIPDVSFPYKVYNFRRVNLPYPERDDYVFEVDIWDKSISTDTVDRIGDAVEALFNNQNYPTVRILPTFYRESRYPVEESDKNLQHLRLQFSIQNYERV